MDECESPFSTLASWRSIGGCRELRSLSESLDIPLGWHDILDLVWILSRAVDVADPTTPTLGRDGALQWVLAERGSTVISVDRDSRSDPGERLRRRFRLCGLTAGDLESATIREDVGRRSLTRLHPRELPGCSSGCTASGRYHLSSRAPGQVLFHKADLAHLTSLATALGRRRGVGLRRRAQRVGYYWRGC